VLFDALVLPDGSAAEALARDGHVLEFVKDQYRHCKPILALGGSSMLLEVAGIRTRLACGGGVDPGVLVAAPDDLDAMLDQFMVAIAKHRHFERESDPPRV
jgi:catalase